MKIIDKAIDMIWHTSIDGTITPIRFNIQEKSGSKKAYSVLGVKDSKLTRIAGCKSLNFICEIKVQEHIRACEIRYDLNSCKWILFRI